MRHGQMSAPATLEGIGGSMGASACCPSEWEAMLFSLLSRVGQHTSYSQYRRVARSGVGYFHELVQRGRCGAGVD